jgi:hypothetical protein
MSILALVVAGCGFVPQGASTVTRPMPVHLFDLSYGYMPGNLTLPHPPSTINVTLPSKDFALVQVAWIPPGIGVWHSKGTFLLIPKGWIQQNGAVGTDGSGFILFTPSSIKHPKGKPQISINSIPGCQGCAGAEGVYYFPFLRQHSQQLVGTNWQNANQGVSGPSWYGGSLTVVPDVIEGSHRDLAVFSLTEPKTGDMTQGIVYAPIAAHPPLPRNQDVTSYLSLVITLSPSQTALFPILLSHDAKALGMPSAPLP